MHLKSAFRWRTLANLNLSCQVIREVTLPVLYETVIWEDPLEFPWTQDEGDSGGWQYTKYLFLLESFFAALQRCENNDKKLALPLDAFPNLFPKLVFIILVADPFFRCDDNEEAQVVIDRRVHLYGEITPMNLVVESVTRGPNPLDSRHEPFQEFLDSWNDRWEGKEESVGEKKFFYESCVKSMTLHRHARLLTNDTHPLELLQDKKSRTNPFEWSFDLCHEHHYDESPKLDIRFLRKDDLRWEETLQGCVWLSQTNSRMAGSGNCHYPGAAVECRPEILPLIQTYVTQTPSVFFITLTDDLSVSQFVALNNLVVKLLESIPELTQQAREEPGHDNPFLAIRAGELDDEAEVFLHRHRAWFDMSIKRNRNRERRRAYFWRDLKAQTWHKGREELGTERTGGWLETAELLTKHQLGPDKRTKRKA